MAARSEFAGHTKISLKEKYFGNLSCSTKKKYGLKSDEVTPQHIADYTEMAYGKGATGHAKCGIPQNKMKRQANVINFFEKRVVELMLKNLV